MADKYGKTDNGHFAAKIALRQHFLRKYHAGHRFKVFDCCQGSGLIWKHLRQVSTIGRSKRGIRRVRGSGPR